MDTRTMEEKAKEARRAYKREWNRKNRDKVKAAQARFWAKKAAEMEAQKDREGQGAQNAE